MPLYLINNEGEEHYVEARNMIRAIATWQLSRKTELDEWNHDPELVCVINDNAVLREPPKPKPEPARAEEET